MCNICFLSWPIYSHVKNSLPIVEELINTGNKVFYFGDEKFKYLTDGLDITFIPYNVSKKLLAFKYFNLKYRKVSKVKEINTKKELLDFIKLQCEFKIEFYNIYLKSVEKVCRNMDFDLIFHDACSYHGKILSEKLNIKSYGFVTSLLFDELYLSNNTYLKLGDLYHYNLNFLDKNDENNLLYEINQIHEDVSKKYNVPKFPVMASLDTSEDYNIIFSSNILQPNTYKSHNFICKPQIFMNEQENTSKKDSNLIYVSTGAYLSAKSEFYNAIINAFKDTEYNVLISLPALDRTKIKRLPKNIEIVKQVNQSEVLKETKIFITHGGYNGICEAIYNCTPMLVYPLTNDQYLNARLIEECGIGYNIKGIKLNKQNLLRIVDKIGNSEDIINNLKIHNKAMKNSKSLSESIKDIIYDL